MVVENFVETAGLVLIPVYAVFDAFGSVTVEMVGLTLHWAHASIQEEELFEL